MSGWQRRCSRARRWRTRLAKEFRNEARADRPWRDGPIGRKPRLAAGDEIRATITSREASFDAETLAPSLQGCDAAIDFSVGSAVARNVEACARAGVPLVEGTTGWKEQEAEVRRIIKEHDGALVFGANFSIGVNVFYRIVEDAARLMSGLDQYQAFIVEEHHSRKRDAPSGTALKLKELMAATYQGGYSSDFVARRLNSRHASSWF